VRAAQNKMDVDFGWFADPIHFGDYPATLKRVAGANLPTFSEADKALLRKSYDYMGMTLYTAKYARSNGNPDGWWVIVTDPSGK
jgi:beta-glucosidase